MEELKQLIEKTLYAYYEAGENHYTIAPKADVEIIINLIKKSSQPLVMPNEVIGGGHLTEKEMNTIVARIDPAFYDVELDGADKSKDDFLRRLKIIFNDILDSRREA